MFINNSLTRIQTSELAVTIVSCNISFPNKPYSVLKGEKLTLSRGGCWQSGLESVGAPQWKGWLEHSFSAFQKGYCMYFSPGNSLDSSSPQQVFVQTTVSPFLGVWWPSTKARYCISKHYMCSFKHVGKIKLEALCELLPRAGWTQRTCELSHYWRTCLKRISYVIFF